MVAHASSRFEDALSTLKETGSALLVVGTVPDETFLRVTSQLLGEGSEKPRRRLIVTTEEKLHSLKNRLPESPYLTPAQSTRIVTLSEPERSAAVASTDESMDFPVESVSKEDLSGLSRRVLVNIEEFERVGGSFQPAELRLSIDSLTALLRANGQEQVFRMVHPLNNVVREKRGMAHYHLPVDRESATARTFAPLFDAIIDLRVHDGDLQQQWHLQEPDLTSEWLPVES